MQTRLRELRKERRLTLQELADLVNISYSNIATIERGERSFTNETIAIFTDFFGVSADYLLGLSDERNTTPKQQLSDSQIQILSGIDNLTEEQAQSVLNYIKFLKTQK